MAASIELYDQAGTLIFDSSKPRILRYAGEHQLLWEFVGTTPSGQGKVYNFQAKIPTLPNWNQSNGLIEVPWAEHTNVNFDSVSFWVFSQGSVDTQWHIDRLNREVNPVKVYVF
ncbi:hypothetical protein [Acinetobacter baumannii]|uniref:hypothetical protein n=1 Tax=Acinetobacter baumannii TaxID=470 RepID=UPI00338F732D